MTRGTLCGAGALVCFLVHAGVHVVNNRAPEAFWICTLASIWIGVGGLLSSPALIAVGVSWVVYGTPLWLLDLLTGGELLPSSLLTHVLAPGLGLFALARMGWPPGTWWRAFAAALVALALSRAFLPREKNVNLVFAVPSGWDKTFPSHPLYLALLLAGSLVVFVLVELGGKRAFR